MLVGWAGGLTPPFMCLQTQNFQGKLNDISRNSFLSKEKAKRFQFLFWHMPKGIHDHLSLAWWWRQQVQMCPTKVTWDQHWMPLGLLRPYGWAFSDSLVMGCLFGAEWDSLRIWHEMRKSNDLWPLSEACCGHFHSLCLILHTVQCTAQSSLNLRIFSWGPAESI